MNRNSNRRNDDDRYYGDDRYSQGYGNASHEHYRDDENWRRTRNGYDDELDNPGRGNHDGPRLYRSDYDCGRQGDANNSRHYGNNPDYYNRNYGRFNEDRRNLDDRGNHGYMQPDNGRMGQHPMDRNRDWNNGGAQGHPQQHPHHSHNDHPAHHRHHHHHPAQRHHDQPQHPHNYESSFDDSFDFTGQGHDTGNWDLHSSSEYHW